MIERNPSDRLRALYSSINDCPEDIQAYVKEVTLDIATEIKSELREVISKVDNVLESTEALDTSGFSLATFQQQQQLTSADEMKGSSDAVSASDVAQYLHEFSIEMASKVKSEIREMCASVQEFNEGARRSPTDLDGLNQCLKAVMGTADLVAPAHRRSDTVITQQQHPRSCDLKATRSESFPAANTGARGASAATVATAAASGCESRTQVRHTGAISKLSDSTETTASRDSGINMCFFDSEAAVNQSAAR